MIRGLRVHRGELLALAAVLVGLVLLVREPGLLLAGVGAALFLAGAVARPLAGLQGVVAALPFFLIGREVAGQTLSPVEAALLLTTAGIVARAAWGFWRAEGAPRPAASERGPGGRGDAGAPWWGGEGRTSTRGSHFDLPIALFLAAALLSLLATEYLRLSLRELRTLIVEPVLFWYLCRLVVRTEPRRARLIATLLAVTSLVAAYGLAQLVYGGAVTDVQGVRRIQGTYTSPNHFALLLGRTLPFLLAGAWLLPRWRPVLLAAGLVCGGALLATFSLGGWLATGAAMLVVVGLLGGRRPVIGLAAAGTLVGVVVLLGAPVERLAGRFDLTQGTGLVRVQLWGAAVELIQQSPLLGIGLDNFLYRYPVLMPPGTPFEPNLSHPHNLVLQFWLELGLPGLVAICWLLWTFERPAWKSARKAGESVMGRALAVGALGSMTDFVVHGLVDNSYFLPDMAIIFWLMLLVAAGGRGSATPLLVRGSSTE